MTIFASVFQTSFQICASASEEHFLPAFYKAIMLKLLITEGTLMISDINSQIIANRICWRDGWKTMLLPPLQVRGPPTLGSQRSTSLEDVPVCVTQIYDVGLLQKKKKRCDTAAGHRNRFARTKTSWTNENVKLASCTGSGPSSQPVADLKLLLHL